MHKFANVAVVVVAAVFVAAAFVADVAAVVVHVGAAVVAVVAVVADTGPMALPINQLSTVESSVKQTIKREAMNKSYTNKYA